MPPPPLPDDLIEEVLLRVRADDPASLVRAALACRRWCRLVADPAFRRRRLHHHGAAPPMLGFLCECDGTWSHYRQPFARFVPMSTCCPPRADHHGLRSLDARHGRVLLQDRLCGDLFVVWDPVTGQRAVLPRPPPSWSSLANGSVKATVLCAATASGTCDHLDCHRRPFIVVLVGTNDVLLDDDDDDGNDYYVSDSDSDSGSDSDGNGMVLGGKMFTCTYSSESGAWSDPATYPNHSGDNMHWGRSALVCNTLFLKLRTYHRILKYDLCTQETSVVGLPHVRAQSTPTDSIQIELTTFEDGRLGFVRMEESNKLCLWSRDHEGGGVDRVAGWTLRNVIDLKKLFPLVDSLHFKHRLVGVVEGVCVAFMAVQKRGLFTIGMKTGLMNKVSEDFGTACCAVPYIDFCTPAMRAPSRDDEPVEETPPGNPR